MDKKSFINAVNNLGTLTAAEERITQYFVAHYTTLPFAKIDELCKQIGVGKATLGRFLQHLGFTGFLEFKKQVTDEFAQTLTTPIERYESTQQTVSEHSILEKHYDEVISNIAASFAQISESDFNRAIDYMQDQKGKLYVIGSASSEALANYFYLLARYLRKDVILLKADISTLPHQLADVTKDDKLLAISYHRFSTTTLRLVKWFHQHGGKIIFVTDQPVNPFVAYCDIQFSVESTSEGFFNNRTAGFALIELFIKGLSRQKEKNDRFKRIESLFDEFKVF
ncbi:MurR/RpiR family transcriptional regulator [Photobacterium leiognathi]|uniref:MurR/RpiR family transcriptional regulator n=1 Tax=Photobacterium leiognathi TaxID=553611 RepID=UPI000D156344|nr:MurR/RpiR family transcriptional regulator [Photobacterium leiognathi]MCG3887416.1 MurR/RpiR family transcriptional regulator [Photobacterium leiognathi]PSW66194.1 MurR/RpiR family transcriptional regulator [Photobacterium leiognathi subsp. mandapamensis]